MKRIVFTLNAWEDYCYWQENDRRMARKINSLIKDCTVNPSAGTGKPEPLKYDLAGFWSRRIDREHRLVYRVEGEELQILSCRYHYDP